MKKIIVSAIALMSMLQLAHAEPNVGQQRTKRLNKTAAGCNQTTAVIDLDVNNVRARLMTGGDMWWDRATGTAQYEVPKGNNTNALFAGSLWIGGFDRFTGDLKVAAQTYRQSGNDYWTGPLDRLNGDNIDFQTCADWDRFWKINSSDVNNFRALYESCGSNQSCINNVLSSASGQVADVIKEWPGSGSLNALGSTNGALTVPNRDMAPFFDLNNDGIYNWRDGDYPVIRGDQFIWWIFNDKGDAKTETQSDAIGLEVHAAAFAFSTNDCLNEATFYEYTVNNFSTSILDSCYMATWTDADMGYAFDDFIGCDTTRGLGILYNGDSDDEGVTGYGTEIPMVGIDFFEGPVVPDPNDPNGTIELGMSVFTYYNNDFSRTGNPETRDDFYGYMTGTWKDNSFFTQGCDPDQGGLPTTIVFPGDPCKTGVSEPSCSRTPADRRFIHSSGPIELLPGQDPTQITIGAIWVPNAGSGSSACFSKIQVCDDKAQELFERDFELPFGPQAPEVKVTPLDKKLIFQLTNLETSNNYNEGYGTDFSDPKFIEITSEAVRNGYEDSTYVFEGYVVYQLKDATVALSDIRSKDGSINTDVARIAFQCDVQNGVEEIYNFEIDPEITSDYFQTRLMATGTDEGIRHSFEITKDLFSSSASQELTNYKTYHFIALAYGYNKYDSDGDGIPDDFDPSNIGAGQQTEYIESRTDGKGLAIQLLSVMPDPAKDSLYVQTYAEYGTGVQLTRIEGIGNGGMDLRMSTASEMEAVNGGDRQVYNPTYLSNHGPADVYVVDPSAVVPGNFELWIRPTANYTSPVADTSLGAIADSTTWFMVNLTTGDTVYSERNIANLNEQLIQEWGLAANIKQTLRPGDDDTSGNNALITSRILFEDPTQPWLFGVPDRDGETFLNWIRAGEEGDITVNTANGACDVSDYGGKADRLGKYEDVIDGTWAPYALAAERGLNQTHCGDGILYNISDRSLFVRVQNLFSVNVVYTSDQSMWTKCPVIEMTDNSGTNAFGEGGQYKFNIRRHASWDKGYDENNNPTYHPTETGWSWFPGYAVNLETGERLNIFFGEESANGVDNGDDMIYNPTSTFFNPINGRLIWGGKHIVYVQNTKYDEGNQALTWLRGADGSSTSFGSNNTDLRQLFRTVAWVGNTMLANGTELATLKDGIVPTNARVEIRVERPYDQFTPNNGQAVRNNGWPIYGFSTNDLAPATVGDGRNSYTDDKDAMLARIQPVPNPYYAYSEYENDRLDNRVRIINLPEKATIKIYTIDGSLVRVLNKNDEFTNFIDWDVKNNQNIPISSGMYLMHVEIPDVGETVLKWFGAMRPVDLTSF